MLAGPVSDEQSPPATTPHVALVEVGKRFQGTAALTGVSLTIAPGSIHALVGENGAGKSTLGKIISGAIRADSGQMFLNGRPVDYRSPREALADRVAAIQQEIALVPRRSVLDNVFLGLEQRRFGMVDVRQLRHRFDELNEESGFDLEPGVLVASLSIAEQQKVEIMRALARDSRLIVMDEPTARLSAGEVEKLLGVIRQLQQRGVTIVFVSHFLREVLAIAGTVTVLRNGQVVQTTPAATQTPDSLITAMLGRAASSTFPARVPPASGAPAVLAVRDISRPGAFDQISFSVRAGEIVGLAGLVGSGRSEVARAIFGADRIAGGAIDLDGQPIRVTSPRDGVGLGMAMLPESRKDQGLLVRLPVGQNVTLPHLARLSTLGVINRRRERSEVGQLLHQLGVRPESPKPLVGRLSGGNQQKVLFAKWLFQRPRILILDEPTRGVDVGAKRAIYELIASLAAGGLPILLISSELEEILGLAHRVLVMRQGRIVTELDADRLSSVDAEETILRAAFGSLPEPTQEIA